MRRNEAVPIFEVSHESKGNKLQYHLQHKDGGEKVICSFHEHFKCLAKHNAKNTGLQVLRSVHSCLLR